ncbi:MAG TPA: PadR family transcriptional regulator [Bryobacteraceae bacterium]|nr:PadR family transcriptional regulator [Bryobacteraceae bacterium]
MRHEHRGRWNEAGDSGDWGFAPPWARRGRFFGPGEVRIAILSLLSEKPRHGYELMKELETRSAGSYRVSAGTMYPSLQQLEDEGMIVSETKDGKRVYQLTELGKQELDRERATADEIWRRTSDWGEWGRWRIGGGPLGPLIKAAVYAMKRASRDPESWKRVEEIMDRARRELENL